MKHLLPALPFANDALEPYMSAETLSYHHGKHHRAYVDKLNQLILGSEFEDMPLEQIVLKSSGPIFNNAAQAWNHDFFWNSLVSHAGAPNGALAKAIQRDFGSLESLMKIFNAAAAGVFGSGWAWLVAGDDDALAVEVTSNADNPLRHGKKPLLTCDVWEHAYYIDYRNDRARYLENFSKIINWEFAEKNFSGKGLAAA